MKFIANFILIMTLILSAHANAEYYFVKLADTKQSVCIAEDGIFVAADSTHIYRGEPGEMNVTFTFSTEKSYVHLWEKESVIYLTHRHGSVTGTLKSYDCGKTWQIDNTEIEAFDFTDGVYYYISVFVPFGTPYLKRSTDCIHWETILEDETSFGRMDSGYIDQSGGLIYAATQYEIQVSYNHGDTWSITSTESYNIYLSFDSIIRFEYDYGIVRFYSSDNLGASWINIGEIPCENIRVFQINNRILIYTYSIVHSGTFPWETTVINDPIIFTIDQNNSLVPYSVIPDIYYHLLITDIWEDYDTLFLTDEGSNFSPLAGITETYYSTSNIESMNDVSLLGIPEDPLLSGDELRITLHCNVKTLFDLVIDYYVALEIGGIFFFAPSWTQDLNSYTIHVEPGLFERGVLYVPFWPYGVGNGSANIYAAGIYAGNLVSNFESKIITWSE